MNSSFFISVGGTGAKVCEAFAHLCSAGYMGYGVDSWVHCMMVDPDTANGTLDRCLQTLDLYGQCESLPTGQTSLFGAKIGNNRQPYTPVDPQRNTLRAMFQTEFHADHDDPAKRGESMLVRALFSDDEIDQSLEQGFRGHPAIGAATFGRSVVFTTAPVATPAKAGVGVPGSELPKNNVWHDFAGKLQQRAANGTVRILFVGSIFGGSGASGIPTLVRLIHDTFAGQFAERLQLGLILYQPYFDFKKVVVAPGDLAASSENFALASAEALQYYADSEYFRFCRSIYTLGEQARSYIPEGGEKEGGQQQKNAPHYLELVGALGAVEFFRGSRDKDRLFVAARATDQGIGWSDLPQPTTPPDATGENTRTSFEEKLKRMTRFALTYHQYFFEQMKVRALRDNWDVYKTCIHHSRESEALQQLSTVNDYCVFYLQWLISVLRPHGSGLELNLFDVDQIGVKEHDVWRLWTPEEYLRGRVADRLPRLVIQAGGSPEGPDLNSIRTRAGELLKDVESGSEGAGRLVRVLYDAC